MTSLHSRASAVVKHSLAVAGHRTSISLEQAFWTALKAIAARRGQSVGAIVAGIDRERGDSNLSSAIRVFVLHHAVEAQDATATTGSSDVIGSPPP